MARVGGRPGGQWLSRAVALASAEPDRGAGQAGPASCVPPEAWRRPPQPEYLIFAGS